MKAWEPSRDSLHYRLAKTYGQMYDWPGRNSSYNSCQYIRYVIKGSIILLLILFLGGLFLGVPQGNLIAWAVASVQYHMVLTVSEVGGIGVIEWCAATMIAMAIGIVFGFLMLRDKIREYRATHGTSLPDTGPSFISVAYDTFHKKYCIPVKFK